jgi:hypothetical protein
MDKQKVRSAIVLRFGTQCAAAKELGINERRLSRLLNGHDQIRPEEAQTFEEKLGVSFLKGALR